MPLLEREREERREKTREKKSLFVTDCGTTMIHESVIRAVGVCGVWCLCHHHLFSIFELGRYIASSFYLQHRAQCLKVISIL